jgi:predicted short-subunit dehydrogenase-like oxidoreductase (DUF2520 family)
MVDISDAKPKEITISIIGAGRLGTSLGFALGKRGYSVRAVSCRTIGSAMESSRIIGKPLAFTDNVRAAKAAKVVILTVPDGAISQVVRELACSELVWKKRFVFHCSGPMPAKILRPLKDRGAEIAAVHPVQTFCRKKTPLGWWRGVCFGLEGDGKALALARQIVTRLGGYPLVVPAKARPLYHIASSIASNYLLALIEMAADILSRLAISRREALQMLLPLVQGTLRNVKQFDAKIALTGPIIRGDARSVKMHLKALQRFPAYLDIYKKMGLLALQMADREKLGPRKIRALRRQLEDR